ncbi:MAG: CarD family transcriptional regulator [Alphaproteobacteria bacterium]
MVEAKSEPAAPASGLQEAPSPAPVAPEPPAKPALIQAPAVAMVTPPAPAPAPRPAPPPSISPLSPPPPTMRPNVQLGMRPPGGGPPRPGMPMSSSPKPPAAPKQEFKTGDYVVYPTHGVGTVQGIRTVEAAGYSLQVIEVTFEENRMKLSVPVNKASSSGLRKLCTTESFQPAMDTLKGRARIKRTMWSRRAQEYEAKINSGDPVQIAEVVRDLFRNAGQPDQSFSERQIYELALDRLAAEAAAIDRCDKPTAIEKLMVVLRSGAAGSRDSSAKEAPAPAVEPQAPDQ